MLKKSTNRASSGARIAADGTSIMTPVTIRSGQAAPLAATASRASSRSSRSSRTSPIVATIAAMTWGVTPAAPAARQIARS